MWHKWINVYAKKKSTLEYSVSVSVQCSPFMRPISPYVHGHIERGGHLNKGRALSIRKKGEWRWSRQPTVSYMISQVSYLPFSTTYNLKNVHTYMRHIHYIPSWKQHRVSASNHMQFQGQDLFATSGPGFLWTRDPWLKDNFSTPKMFTIQQWRRNRISTIKRNLQRKWHLVEVVRQHISYPMRKKREDCPP